MNLDPWQQFLLRETCATRPLEFFNPYTGRIENKWAAFEVGVVVSRQNGKGSYLEARELAGLFLFGERLIIHSAHQFDTSKEAFERILMLIEDTPDLDEHMWRVSRSHGEEGIEVKMRDPKTGKRGKLQRLRFRTRTKGGGRGFTSDCLVLDEAMYLQKEAIRALMPTMSARPNAQLIYTGSAGDKDARQLGAVRARAISGKSKRLFYAEWSIDYCNAFCPKGCDEHDRIDDPRSWAKANPGMGIRIDEEYIEAEYDSIGRSDPEGFLQERLGVGSWPVDDSGWSVIDKPHWESCSDQMSQLAGGFAIGVDTSPDLSMSCISVCGVSDSGLSHIEIPGNEDSGYDHRPGTQWVVPRLKALVAQHKPVAVVIDSAGQAATFIAELEGAGITVTKPNSRQYATACGDLFAAVCPRRGENQTLVHIGQPPLNAAVAAADTRTLADLWAWSRRTSAADITPLCAATLAMYGWKSNVHEVKSVAPWAFTE